MIQIITLNPAMDRTLTLNELTPGSVLRADHVVSMAGGKGLNVARFLKQLDDDLEIEIIGFIGGWTGDYILDECDRMGISKNFIHISSPNRVCFTILEPNQTTVINEPGPVISQNELAEFWNVIRKTHRPDIVLISGSAPLGVPTNIYADLIRYYRELEIPVFLDTSGDYLAEGIKAGPYFVKPNESEFRDITHLEEGDLGELTNAAQQLLEDGVKNIAISLGEKGLLYVTDGESPWHIPALTVHVVNVIASGDAFMAGAVYSTIRNHDIEYTLKFATAAAAMNTTSSIPYFPNPAEIKDWSLKVNKYILSADKLDGE